MSRSILSPDFSEPHHSTLFLLNKFIEQLPVCKSTNNISSQYVSKSLQDFSLQFPKCSHSAALVLYLFRQDLKILHLCSGCDHARSMLSPVIHPFVCLIPSSPIPVSMSNNPTNPYPPRQLRTKDQRR